LSTKWKEKSRESEKVNQQLFKVPEGVKWKARGKERRGRKRGKATWKICARCPWRNPWIFMWCRCIHVRLIVYQRPTKNCQTVYQIKTRQKPQTKTANENRRATAALPWLLTLVGWAAQPVHIVVVSTRNSPSETRSPAAESGFDWTPCDIVASDSRRMTTLQTSSSAFVQLWFATLQIGLNHSFITLSTGIAAICHRYLIGKVCYMLSP